MASAQARFDETLARIDSVLDRRVRRIDAIEAKADADERRAAAAQAREDADRCRSIAERYDPAFMAHGTQTPQPVDDEAPGKYRRRLFSRLQRKLPDSHDLVDIDPYDLPASALRNFETMLIEAATGEGNNPSADNLPEDGTLIERQRVDDMGSKSINWYGKESFIKGLSRGGQRVVRLINPKTGDVLKGPPFPKDPRPAFWR
jgi:hypothetical protein